jgi:adenosine deaminase
MAASGASTGTPDLHRHLDGSLRRSTLRELAGRAGVALPDDVRFAAGMGLDGALARFALTLAVLQDAGALARVASEICEDASADGVTTLELRFAPQLHGATDALASSAPDAFRAGPASARSIDRAIDAVLEGVAGRAGVILCALYGDPPALVDALVDAGASRRGVVGIDLAGGPAPSHAFAMRDYAAAFRRAAARGLGRTVHAGEGRPPDEIRVAIEALGAQRIGHGTTLLADPSVVELVLARGVTIEACPTSNVHTGAIAALADHPLAAWLARGVRACVNTDNTLFSDVQSSDEHARARALPGMSDALLAAAIAHGRAAAFTRA